MRTELLYLKNSYLKECEATVIDCICDNEFFLIELDKTIFFTECGSQPSDKGYIDDNFVSDMKKIDDRYYHVIDKSITIGTIVKLKIDFERRYDFMQCHSGEALLSGVLYKKFNINQLSFHLNEHNLTIDIDKRLTDDECIDVIDSVNMEIFMNRRYICHYPKKEELNNYNLRRNSEEFDAIRLIEIQGLDIAPCGGTHILRTGELGGFSILKTENIKKGQRIYFIFGKRFLEYNKKQYKLLKFLKLTFNGNLDNMQDKILEKLNSFKTEKIKYIETEKKIISMMKNTVLKNSYELKNNEKMFLIVNVYDEILNQNSFNILINELIKECEADEKDYILVCLNKKEKISQLILYTTNVDNYSLIDELNNLKEKYLLKGGGNSTRIQLLIDEEYVNSKELFISIIENIKQSINN